MPGARGNRQREAKAITLASRCKSDPRTQRLARIHFKRNCRVSPIQRRHSSFRRSYAAAATDRRTPGSFQRSAHVPERFLSSGKVIRANCPTRRLPHSSSLKDLCRLTLRTKYSCSATGRPDDPGETKLELSTWRAAGLMMLSETPVPRNRTVIETIKTRVASRGPLLSIDVPLVIWMQLSICGEWSKRLAHRGIQGVPDVPSSTVSLFFSAAHEFTVASHFSQHHRRRAKGTMIFLEREKRLMHTDFLRRAARMKLRRPLFPAVRSSRSLAEIFETPAPFLKFEPGPRLAMCDCPPVEMVMILSLPTRRDRHVGVAPLCTASTCSPPVVKGGAPTMARIS